MNGNEYEMIVAGRILSEDEYQQLAALNCQAYHYPDRVTSSIDHLLSTGYGLVITPGWENDKDAVLLVQIAKAFQIPAKTHQLWLQTLPTPPAPNEEPAWSGMLHELTDSDAALVDLENGDIIHADASVTAEGSAGFVEIVNLDLDILEPPTHLPTALEVAIEKAQNAERQAGMKALYDRAPRLVNLEPDTVVVPLTPDEENDDTVPTLDTGRHLHTWFHVDTLPPIKECTSCGEVRRTS